MKTIIICWILTMIAVILFSIGFLVGWVEHSKAVHQYCEEEYAEEYAPNTHHF